jgi:lipoic acid synthetase
MILGDVCTRGCRYCAVSKGKPLQLDQEEPYRVAEAVGVMKLKHAVVTSVDRDDVSDGGAAIFARTIETIRERNSECVVEVLVPDFQGSKAALDKVLEAGPEVLAHNIETVPRLYPKVRSGGDYLRSLELLDRARRWTPELVTKTGMMLGLGEREDEIHEVLKDLVEKSVQILTLGQYLRPTPWHLPVVRHYHPDEFRFWKEVGESMGFEHVESGPLVRSSYLADRQLAQINS